MAPQHNSAGESAAVGDLGLKNFANQLASLLHFGYGERTIDLFSVAASRQHSCRLQDCKVLRDICLRYAQLLLQLRYPDFSVRYQVEHLKPLRVRECFADASLPLEDLCVSRTRCLSSSHRISGHQKQGERRNARPSFTRVTDSTCVHETGSRR